MINRRQALADSLMGVLGISTAIPDPTEHRGLDWMIDTFGEQAVAEAIARKGGLDVSALRKELRQAEKRYKRHVETRRRRERNRDTVLFRGPVSWGCLDPSTHRVVRSRTHRVAVMSIREDLSLGPDVISAGSRVVIDLRNGIPEHPMCELVETSDGSRRIHLWGFRGEFDPARGRSFATIKNHQPDDDLLYEIQESIESSMKGAKA